MKQLTREQQAVYNFQISSDLLRPVVEPDESEGSKNYEEFYDYFIGAISKFIDSELNFRQGDRCSVLNLQPDLMNYSNNIGTEYNQTGIDVLTDALTSFNNFKNTQTDTPVTDSEFQIVLDEYRDNLKQELLKLEIKGSDVQEYGEQIDLVLDTLLPGNNGMDLLNYTSSKIQELIDIRNSPTRGAETNIAIWKLLAAAVIIGVGSWVIYKCYWSSRRCSKKQKSKYNTILFIAMVTFGACE